MATYTRTYNDDEIDQLSMCYSVIERSIYGSSRVANFVDSVQLAYLEAGDTEFSYPADNDILSHTNGYKHFELTNHLGNVMAVVSDKRTPIITSSEITGYTPELLIAKDYYPFGMEMSGRYTGVGNEDPDNKYRFGFQNQEKDDEWTGQTGSHLNYKYRMYDARIGRFFAIDPLAAKYPYNSTYAFAENNVISGIELEGLEYYFAANGVFLAHNKASDEIRVVTSTNISNLAYAASIIGNVDTKLFQLMEENSKPITFFNIYGAALKGTSIIPGNRKNDALIIGIVEYAMMYSQGYGKYNQILLRHMKTPDPIAIRANNVIIGVNPKESNGQGVFGFTHMGDLISAAIHEGTHLINYGKWVEYNANANIYIDKVPYGSDIDECEAILAQVQDASWANTSDEFRKELFYHWSVLLVGRIANEKGYKEQIEKATGVEFYKNEQGYATYREK